MARQRRTLAGDADDRRKTAGGGDAGEHAAELVVLGPGGPWIAGAWYWRPDFEQKRRAELEGIARGDGSVSTRSGLPMPSVRYYRPTERWERHPDEQLGGGVVGRVWAYCPPMEGSTV